MRQLFPSIRAQLTAWLALLTTVCLVAFAFYLYVAVSHSLTADLDRVLRVQAQQVAVTYHFDASDSGDDENDEQHVDTSVRGPGQHVHGSAAARFLTFL